MPPRNFLRSIGARLTLAAVLVVAATSFALIEASPAPAEAQTPPTVPAAPAAPRLDEGAPPDIAGARTLPAPAGRGIPAPQGQAPGANPGAGRSKISSRLLDVSRAERGVGIPSAASAAAMASARAGMRFVGQQVRVEIEAEALDTANARASIAALGGTFEAEYEGTVLALVPPAALEALSERAGVSYVREPFPMVAQEVTGQGPGLIDVGGAWAAAGYTGTGVKVAIIDLGFAGLAARQAAGDLPAGVTTVDYCSGGFSTGTAHGTGVAEIVHEVAPNAQLYLICVGSSVQLGQAKDYVIANGIQIVNHSVGWFNSGRGDGTGPAGSPAAIVNAAQGAGVLWVNSAGNSGLTHWSGTFNDPTNPPSGTQIHQYNTSPVDVGNTFSLGGLTQVCVAMKWDAWPTTTIDYDLQIRQSADGAIVASSANNQAGGAIQPVESLCYTNPSSSAANHYIAITRKSTSGAGTPRIDYWAYAGVGALEYIVTAGSMTEPATSPNAYAVGAACWNPVSGGGLQSFSSQGPTIDGRTSPDIVGYDAVSSGTYGNYSNCSTGFTGTSAAAPHVAGAAAILFGMTPSATTVRALLDSYAAAGTDYGAAGKDNAYGNGKLRLGPVPVSNSVSPTIQGIARVGQTLAASPGTWTGSPTFAYQWRRCASNGESCVSIGGGTASTYLVAEADFLNNGTIRVIVTATNATNASAESSAATQLVMPASLTSPVNPGFELGTAYWSALSGASIGLNTANERSGVNAGEVTVANSDGSGARAQDGYAGLNVTVGHQYTFGAWLRLTTLTARSIGLRINWLDATGATIATSPSTVQNVTNLNAWSQYFTIAIAPIGATYASLDIVTDGAQGSWSFLIDDVTFTGTGVPQVGGMLNGGFEANTTYWDGGGATLTRSTATAKSGSASLQVAIASNGGAIAQQNPEADRIRVFQGRSYTFSAWVRLDTAGSKNLTTAIYWYNSGNSSILGTPGQAHVVTTTDWSQQISITAVAPAGATWASPQIFRTTAQGAFTFYLDDVTWSETAPSGSALPNPHFEIDSTYWQPQSGAALARSAVTTKSGHWALKVDTVNANASGARAHLAGGSRLPVIAGAQYQASAWVRLEQVGSKALGLNINWFDAGGGFISNSHTTLVVNSQNWSQQLTLAAIAPGGAAFASFDVNTAGAQGVFTFYLDDAAWVLTALNATSVANGGFEVNANFWYAQSGATLTRVSSTARTGSASLQIDAADANASGARVQLPVGERIAVTAGQPYEAAVYGRLASAGSKNLILNINWFNSGGGFISNSFTMVTLNSTDWSQRLSLAAVAPAGATHAAFDINTAGAQGAFTFHLDEATWGAPSAPITTVANPGFETDTSYWQGQGSAGITRDTAQARSGSASLRVDAADQNASGARAHLAPGGRISVSEGTAYTVSAYGRLASAGSYTLILNVNWFNSGGGFVSNSITALPLNSTSWTLLSLAATAPGGAAFAAFDINTAGAQGTFTFYLDDANWEEGGATSPITTVANAGFETNTDYWQAQGSGSIARDTGEARSGSASLRVDAANENASGARAHLAPNARITVTAGTTYTMGVYGKLASAASHTLILNINWFNSSGGFVSNSITAVPLNAATWTALSLTVAAPSGAAFAAFDINTAGAQGTFTFYLDDASWAEGGGGGGGGGSITTVSNPGFETNTDYWQAQGSGSVARDTGEARSGNASLRIDAANENASGARAHLAPNGRIEVTAGTSYTMGVYGKLASAASHTLILNINWFNSSGGFVSNSITAAPLNSTSWTLLSLTATAPGGAAFAAFDINTAGAQGTFTFYLDDASWAEGGGAITAVSNPGFESDTSYWQPQGSASITRDTGEFRSGSASLRVDATNENASGARAHLAPNGRIAVNAGTSYTLAVYGKLATGSTKNLILNINWFNSSGAFVSNSITGVSLSSTSWALLTFTAAAPGGAAFAAFDINTAGAQGAFTFYLDDASWGEAAAAVTTVTNPGFESNTAGWQPQGGASLTRDTSEFRSGSASLRVDAANENASGARAHLAPADRITVTAGTSYTMAVYGKLASAGSHTLILNINWFNSSGGFVSNSIAGVPFDSTTWILLTLTATAPGSAAFAAFDINTAGAQGTFTFYLDDAEWAATPTELLNGGFETNTDHWLNLGSSAVVQRQTASFGPGGSTPARTGSASLMVRSVFANEGGRVQSGATERILVNAGQTYTISMYARVGFVTMPAVRVVRINWFARDGVALTPSVSGNQTINTTNWSQTLELAAQAPAGAVTASIDIYAPTAPAHIDVFIDDVTWS